MAGIKTEMAKQALVRHIRESGMKTGEKLPPQSVLRQILGFGGATVGAAINELKNDGVLDVRDKIGVYLLDPDMDGHAGRVIGITARYVEGSPYYACLLGVLQQRLISEGCSVHIFCFSKKGIGRDLSDAGSFFYDIDDYPGLRRMVESNTLDGIIHLDDFTENALRLFKEKKLPTLFVGAIDHSPNSLTYHYTEILRNMCRIAAKSHFQRPALICQTSTRAILEPLFHELVSENALICDLNTIGDAKCTAERLIAMPDETRPDVLLYFDDVLAQVIAVKLILALPKEKLPAGIILRNLQLKIQFPIPEAYYMSIDLPDVAAKAADLLLDAVKMRNTKIGSHYYNIKEN